MLDLLGWLPAVILPLSTGLQLVKILTAHSVKGVSILSWALFGFANLGAYFYTDKLLKPQAILAFLLSAILDFIIVGVALKIKSQNPGNA